MRGSDNCGSFVFVSDAFGRTKTAQVNVSFLVHNKIIWFKIPYYDFKL